MKILLVHNRYLVRGGEDAVVDQERDLLRSHGHEVVEYYKDNRDVANVNKLQLAISSVWATETHAELLRLLEEQKPALVHVHNTLPLISPAIYYAASRQSIPVVQTLHNYRLVCPNGLLMRSSTVCEECVGKSIPWPAVQHRCYRGSRSATFAVAASLSVHRVLGTFRREVTRYITLCQFARQKLLLGGLPQDRVVVKANFAIDRHKGVDLNGPRFGALFVGRLSVEKGVDVLLKAWESNDFDLQIIGPGSSAKLQNSAPPSVRFRGVVDEVELAFAMRRSAFIVMPSLVYEGFPMVVAEAFSAGLPIIASRIGALAELVDDGLTGLHFRANDPLDLAAKVQWAIANPERMREMGVHARQMYERHYTPEINYERLMEIYDETLAIN